MNLFRIIFLDVVLFLFPLLVYLIYLGSNRNIDKNTKSLYFTFALVTSFFLITSYEDSNMLMQMFLLNSIVILSYIEDKCIIANIFVLLILLININKTHYIFYLILMYFIILLFYIIIKKLKINKNIFSIISIILSNIFYVFLIYNFNYKIFNLKELINIVICYIFVISIAKYVYETSKKILNINMTLKELENEKQIRLSLFKITHEIKNPIAVCKGYLDMLNVKDSKQVERYVPILKSEIERLLSLLQDFLLINKNNLDLDVMDMNMLVEETTDKLKPLLEENNIKLDLKLVDDDIYINGDYNRLSQVLINIIKNSIEAIEKEGTISIDSKIKSDKYYLTIKDNGCGMSKEVLEKIKEPFFTTKKRGSGLGISLIYEIIEAHGAKINYSSEYKEGTTVNLVFSMYQ